MLGPLLAPYGFDGIEGVRIWWQPFDGRSAGIDQAADLGRLSENVISHRPNRQENRVSPCRSRREKQPLSAYWLLGSARRDLLKGLDPLDLVPCLNLVQPTE